LFKPSLLPNKQYKIAGETLYIYAPLANRLGLNKIKTELENLSFKYEHPEEYQEIEEKLAASAAEREEAFQSFTAPIRVQLDKMGLKYRIIARVKSIYSIWNKMQTKHVPFEEIFDLLAVRIIFDPRNEEEELNDCFDIYVSISKIYKPHPDRLRDWVSHPKANGYQALHVTLMGNNGQWIEVQIRSERMNDVAEQGFAAHWKYKEGGGSEDEGELEKWLRTIKEILDDPQPDAIDFLDTIKLNLFASEIFVFTPKGEIKTMPQNSTALDFAFSLHTDLGSHCIGAKVNHKLVPLSHKLESGDQVEILTSKSQRVQPSWEVFATTAKARAKIAAILKKEQKSFQKEGERILHDFLLEEELQADESNIEKLCKLHNMKTADDLYMAIGSKNVILGDTDRNELKEKASNWKKYLTFSFGTNKENKDRPEEKASQEKINPKQILKLTDDSIQKNYAIADCCQPIPGDDVLGYMDENEKITIHKRQCPVAVKLKSSFGNRIIATTWDTHKALSFLVYIYIKGIDSVGLLNEITQVISRELNVNIRKLNIETNDGIFEGKIQLYVHDVDDVKKICNNLRKINQIKAVTRVES
jgi:GTP pyrophosphokinase